MDHLEPSLTLLKADFRLWVITFYGRKVIKLTQFVDLIWFDLFTRSTQKRAPGNVWEFRVSEQSLNASQASILHPSRKPSDIHRTRWAVSGKLESSSVSLSGQTLRRPVAPSPGQLRGSPSGFPSRSGLWERCNVSEEEEETNWPGSSSSTRHLRGRSEFVSDKER